MFKILNKKEKTKPKSDELEIKNEAESSETDESEAKLKSEAETADILQANAKKIGESVIYFDKVSKEYAGGVYAVSDVSFSVGVGEFVSLVGPSGAGKSTLIRLLTCEEKPTAGNIYVAGRNVIELTSKELPYYRRKVGIIFQDFKLLNKKTVKENISFALEVAGVSDMEIAEKVPKIIEIVGLTKRAGALAEELSGGEKQRVSIARALVHKPKILIANEPTGNLDPVTTWEIIELLFKINRQGTVVLLATHDKEVVDALQRRVITMRDGKIVADQKHGKYIL